ncbi:MAG: ATP-dependent sacrificial sulfur transferase LarE [Verrucomicrobia bacterium]|nr:ATP-dependent sacrificial sulfur transferase LarE [Verrucomicrobiota bacterium]
MLSQELLRLREVLRGYGSCLVAYSGGVDSVLLAVVARQELGARSLAVIADSPSLPRRELEEALALAQQHGFAVRVIPTREFESRDYTSNPANRCYFCKQALFSELAPIAAAEGFAVIAYGENASDLADYRPGAQAAAEFAVRAPLKEAGLTKADIRAISAELGLPTADKPQMACLSSRIPYGEPVTPEKLRMIELAEAVLRDLGFREVRVRHHELGGGGAGNPTALARIELGAEELPRLLTDGLPGRVGEELRRLGYAQVTLDLAGYRRGSLNAVLGQSASAAPASQH